MLQYTNKFFGSGSSVRTVSLNGHTDSTVEKILQSVQNNNCNTKYDTDNIVSDTPATCGPTRHWLNAYFIVFTL